MGPPAPPFPRGSGGCVLYPGTKVMLHSLKAGQTLNGKEGTCECWDRDLGRMHVKLDDGQVKALKPINLRKVLEKEDVDDDPEFKRVLDVFQKFDSNGDGVIDRQEFTACLKAMGLPETCLKAFLESVDKSGDLEIQYEEFCKWALGPAGKKTKKSTLDVYWPEAKQQPNAESIDADDDEPDENHELTVEDVERICGEVPAGWPAHGCKVLNNMHARFPDYPIEGIVWRMRRNDFVGGKVIAAIRATGAREVETLPPSAVKVGRPGAFPATYHVRGKPMPVYLEGGKTWSFQNLRDRKLNPISELSPDTHFKVLEVKRGNEFGYCFGRIDFDNGQAGTYWVVLGLEANRSHWTTCDRDRGHVDLNYTEAARVDA